MSTLEPARPDATPLRRFHDLYRGEFAFVWSAAQHLGVAPGAVADVVQDVFLTAYRRLDHLRFEVSPRAWLFGVTRRVASRYRRGAARLARRHAAFAELARPFADDKTSEVHRLLGFDTEEGSQELIAKLDRELTAAVRRRGLAVAPR